MPSFAPISLMDMPSKRRERMVFSPDVDGAMEWPSTLRRDVRQVYQSSRQLLELVDDVLDLARIDVAGMPVRRERADLGEVVREAVSTIGDLVRGRDQLQVLRPKG